MDYYELKDNLHSPPDRWFLGSVNFDGDWEFWKYIKAGEVKAPEKELEVAVRQEGIPLDFTFADFSLIIVNQKVADMLSNEEVQLIPVKIKGYKSATRHYIVVIKKEFDCVDEANSTFDKWEEGNPIRPDKAGEYKTIYNLIVKPDNTGENDIFRIKYFNIIVCISEKLKSEFEKKNISGITFKKATL